MATTKNHKIVKTLKKAIEYAMADKKEDELKDDIKSSVAYAINDKTGEIIYPTIHSTINCFSEHPYDTFRMLINEFGKDEIINGNSKTKNGEAVLAWHFHQNFEGHVDPVIANEIGHKLAMEMFGKFPVVIGTHTNTENTHNHIIVCAWNMEGKKWNQDNKAYQKLRNVSDRLCEEYGLSVLEDTRKQKLVKYKDKNGKTHYYEPTERKNKLLKQRSIEERNNYDIGNYSNTMSYEISENKKETMREIIRHDIDRLIPVSNSYEHLLEMLRQLGYIINAKKKNGEWLKHISFQPPVGSKGIRDYKLSDDGFYLRENLEKVIDEFIKDKNKTNDLQDNSNKTIPKYFNDYVYGSTEISDIDEKARTIKLDDEFVTVERGEVERIVINDLKQKDYELKLIDTTEIDRLIAQKENTGKVMSKDSKEIIISQIKESFKALRFMEKESVYTKQQILSITSGIWGKYGECLNNIESIEVMLKQMEKILKIPDKIRGIESRMEKMKNDLNYEENELSDDKQQLDRYRRIIIKYKLDSPDEVKKIESKVIKFKEKSLQLQEALSDYKEYLKSYETCITVLDRIEKENRDNNSILIKDYDEIKKRGQKAREELEEKRNRRNMAER